MLLFTCRTKLNTHKGLLWALNFAEQLSINILSMHLSQAESTYTYAAYLQKVEARHSEPLHTNWWWFPICLHWGQGKAQPTKIGPQKCCCSVSRNIWTVNPPFSPFILLQTLCILSLNPQISAVIGSADRVSCNPLCWMLKCCNSDGLANLSR